VLSENENKNDICKFRIERPSRRTNPQTELVSSLSPAGCDPEKRCGRSAKELRAVQNISEKLKLDIE
jgi:hypothetical protein